MTPTEAEMSDSIQLGEHSGAEEAVLISVSRVNHKTIFCSHIHYVYVCYVDVFIKISRNSNKFQTGRPMYKYILYMYVIIRL